MISKPQVEGIKRGHREKSRFGGWWSDIMPHPEGLGKQGPEVHRSCVATWACAVDYRQAAGSKRPQSRDPGVVYP